VTEVVQWVNWEDFREYQKKFGDPYITTTKEDSRSWHIESFTVHIGHLDLTLKGRIPDGK